MATTTQTEHPEVHELTSPVSWAQNHSPDQGTCEREGRPSNQIDRKTALKLLSALFSFFLAGINDGSVGSIIPYLIRDYGISTAIVSVAYGANFCGWVTAALSNTHLCQFFDTGSMLAIGASFQIIAHALRAWHPPFGLFAATFWIVSLGQAFNDTHANTFVASIKGAHRWLAGIHASYMAGCLVGPFAATAVASAGTPSKWNLFYAVPCGLGLANLFLIMYAFRDSLLIKPKSSAQSSARIEDEVAPAGAAESRNQGALKLIKSTLSKRGVWLLSMFYFFHVGSQITANGWVVEYLVEVRDGDLAQMGYVPAGFNGGCFLARILLAEPTYRLGEKRMVFIYCLLAVALQLVFWLVPNIIASSIAISLIGFVTGPLFATGISLGSKLFPPDEHSTALAFVFVFAGMGGSLFPIITGVVASAVGVAVLQPILIALLAATTISWALVPRPKSSVNAALHQE